MEIPVIINRLTEFEVGMSSLQNPPFLSQFYSTISGFNILHQHFNFWTWSALILALVTCCTTLINRIIFRFLKPQSPPVNPSLGLFNDDEDEYDESDSSSSSSDDDEDEEEMSEDWEENDNQDSGLRRRFSSCSFGDLFSLSELANKKSVVKLWDSLSLGLATDFTKNSTAIDLSSIFSWNDKISAYSSLSSPGMVLSAATKESKMAELRIWDARASYQLPAIVSEWRPAFGKIVDVYGGGVEKVCIRDDLSGHLTILDKRKARSPLENLTKSYVETRWDADAGTVLTG